MISGMVYGIGFTTLVQMQIHQMTFNLIQRRIQKPLSDVVEVPWRTAIDGSHDFDFCTRCRQMPAVTKPMSHHECQLSADDQLAIGDFDDFPLKAMSLS